MIVISEKIIVGHSSPVLHTAPYADIMAVGVGNKVESKKLQKLSSNNTTMFTVDNIPCPGFFITDYQAYRSVWVVVDPRGFKITLNASTIDLLINDTCIHKGLVQDMCVWATRTDSNDVFLLPVSSPIYETAIKDTAIYLNKIDKKSVLIGDEVRLENGLKGIYYGVFSFYGTATLNRRKSDIQFNTSTRKAVLSVDGKDIFYYAGNLKILEITKKSTSVISKNDARDYIQHKIDQRCFFSQSAYACSRSTSVQSIWQQYTHVSFSYTPRTKIVCSYEEIDIDVAEKLLTKGVADINPMLLLVENSAGEKFIIPHTAVFSTFSKNFPVVRVWANHMEPASIDLRELPKLPSIFAYWAQNNGVNVYNLTDFVKYYKIIKHIGKDYYL